MYKPQKEQLPNITGGFGMNEKSGSDGKLFKRVSNSDGWDHIANGDKTNYALNFDASRYSSIYTNNGHVIPANYAANIFIYAGK